MFGETIVVIDGQDEGLAHDFPVGELELEGLVEDGIQRFPVDAGFLLPLHSVRQQINLDIRI